ncbi:universal stress protein [Natronoarchaeum sp. GCM10025703]|uniref:universal stress protein n=1 Tax=unclassified Natronoarchaeum TaxID=2620183 RepID=UPI0036193913
MTGDLLQRLVLPVASDDDAEATARAVEPYLTDETVLSVVHVVEKAGGAPDKAGVEQREEYAEAALSLVEDYFAEHPVAVETEILYGTDVVETVVDHAHSFDATAIAFLPREAGILTRLLTGQTTVSMVTDTDLPVIVLPDPDGDDDE